MLERRGLGLRWFHFLQPWYNLVAGGRTAMPKNFLVTAQWDAEAGIWVATSDDIVGLVTEAASLDALYARVLDIAPELLDENGIAVEGRGMIDFHVLSSFDLSAAE